MSHLLEVKGLTTAFRGDYGMTVSVDHIDFHVDKGEAVCIVGESGSGKSVTAYSIMQILAATGKIVDGSIYYKGEDIAKWCELL